MSNADKGHDVIQRPRSIEERKLREKRTYYVLSTNGKHANKAHLKDTEADEIEPYCEYAQVKAGDWKQTKMSCYPFGWVEICKWCVEKCRENGILND